MRKAATTTSLIAGVVAGLLVQPVAAQDSIRFNCGGEAVSFGNRQYRQDQPYTEQNRAGYLGGQRLRGRGGGGQIAGTRFGSLFQSARVAPQEYRFDLPAGTYLVQLSFAETELHGPGLRCFTVAAEGEPLLEDFDIFALVEKDYAVTFQFAVTVGDGQLNITFIATSGAALVSAIGVQPDQLDAVSPVAVKGLEARGSYHRNVLIWNPVAEPDLAGYHVYRAETESGQLTRVNAAPIPLARFLDDDVSEGQTRYYQVRAVDVWGNEGPAIQLVSATTLGDEDSSLPVFRLSVDQDQLSILQTDPFADDYVSADFAYQGVTFEQVGVRYRGNVTRNQNKKSWKVNFTGDNPFLGMDKLNLNAEANDTTMLKERLCYQLLSRLNVRVPAAWFVHLQVNGEYRGVFTRVEDVDLDLLERYRSSTSGNLYKADSFRANFSLLPDPAEYPNAYIKQSNEDEGYEDLVELIERINTTPDEELLHTLIALIDLDAYLDYYAMVVFSANFDHVFHNYYLYHDLERDIWEVLPKDWNGTFSNSFFAVNYGTAEHPGGPGDGNAYNVLLTRVLNIPELRRRYADKLAELVTTDFSASVLDPLIEALSAEIQTDGKLDLYKIGAERNDLFTAGPDSLLWFMDKRRGWLLPELDAFAPGEPQTVFINELLATGDGETADWIELYNASGTDYDLGGHFLTDDLRQPQQWQVPPGTVLPAGGYLLIQADGNVEAGAEHAGFALATGGEAVGLFGPLGADDPAGQPPVIDFIAFGPQSDGVSFGRRHDGSALWCRQGTPTPGTANQGRGNLPPDLWAHHRRTAYPAAGAEVAVTAMADDDDAVVDATLWYDTGDGWLAAPFLDDGFSDDGVAGDRLYGGTIPGSDPGTTVRYYLAATDQEGRVTTLPSDGAADPFCYAIEAVDSDLLINELLAANDTVLLDDAGDADDWFELYNRGDDPRDLSGMFLSDDLTRPDKWQIPAGTVIEAGGFLLLWADDEEDEGPLHTSFKLGAGGEELGLFDTIERGNGLLDAIVFPAQEADVSYGREHDGAETLVFLPEPTPGSSNSGCCPPRTTTRRVTPND